MDNQSPDWIEIFASPNPALIGALRSALEAEKIEFTVRGELTLAHRGCVMPARVLVRRGDQARATTVVNRFTATLAS